MTLPGERSQPVAESALTWALDAALAVLPSSAPVGVACSGGRDSLALLHLTARRAGAQGRAVVALHVHHGLSPRADDWVACLSGQVEDWQRQHGWPVRLEHERVQVPTGPGLSLEAQARAVRRAALARMAHAAGIPVLLLAHHRDDQAETVLLQALRGGGVAGWAAMPTVADRAGLRWCRPWLDVPRSAIEAYGKAHRLQPVEDESNADPRYARNRLRLRVMPSLRAAFPDAPLRLARSARQAQDALACLDELAAQDRARAAMPAGHPARHPARHQARHPAGIAAEPLSVETLRCLSVPRRRNLLRFWLADVARSPDGSLTPVRGSLIERLAEEVPRVHSARWLLPGGAGWVQVHRGVLSLARGAAPAGSGRVPLADAPRTRLDLQPGLNPLPAWGGAIDLQPCPDGGFAADRLDDLWIGPRSGGERFQRSADGLPRSLKLQFQSAAVPAWARAVPLVWCGAELLFVPGLGLDARQRQPPFVPGWTLFWLPHAADEGRSG